MYSNNVCKIWFILSWLYCVNSPPDCKITRYSRAAWWWKPKNINATGSFHLIALSLVLKCYFPEETLEPSTLDKDFALAVAMANLVESSKASFSTLNSNAVFQTARLYSRSPIAAICVTVLIDVFIRADLSDFDGNLEAWDILPKDADQDDPRKSKSSWYVSTWGVLPYT